MKSAVTKEDEFTAMTTALGGLAAIFCAIAASIAAQPWQTISVFLSIIVLIVIVHGNIVRPIRRRRMLKKPAEAWFVIPAKKHHGCDFSVQDEQEHLTKPIVLPQFSEAFVDLAFFPKIFLTNSELIIGCDGDNAPRPIEYHNRFVEQVEKQRIVPGPEHLHYTDKHGFYHFKEAPPRAWSRGTHRAVAFKFRTKQPGKYAVTIFFSGDEVEGENSELTIVVEAAPNTTMNCVNRKHKKQPCAMSGIKPL